MRGQIVAVSEDRSKRRFLAATPHCIGDEGVMHEDAHPERVAEARHEATDRAAADDAEGLAVEFAPDERFVRAGRR